MKKHHPIKLYVWQMKTDPEAAAKLREEHKDDEVFCAAVKFHDVLLTAIRNAQQRCRPLPFEQHEMFPAIEAPPKGNIL